MAFVRKKRVSEFSRFLASSKQGHLSQSPQDIERLPESYNTDFNAPEVPRENRKYTGRSLVRHPRRRRPDFHHRQVIGS